MNTAEATSVTGMPGYRYPHTSGAELYGTTIRCLIDAADLEQLSVTERTTVLCPAAGLATSRPATVVVMDGGADPAALQRRRRRATVFEPETELSTVEEFLMEIGDQSQEAAALAEAINIGDTSLAALHHSVEEIGALPAHRAVANVPPGRRPTQSDTRSARRAPARQPNP